ITGNMKVNYKSTDFDNSATASTNNVTQEGNLLLVGSNGGTKVHVEVAIDGDNSAAAGDNMRTEDVWMSTTIGDVSVKAGTWNGSDTILAKDGTRTAGNWVLGTSVAGAAISVEGDSNASATKVTAKGDIAGVSTKYVMFGADATTGKTKNELYLSTDVAGFGVTYAMIDSKATTSDAAAFTISKEFNGVTVSYSDVDADASYTVTGDTAAFGDAAAIGNAGMKVGDDATSIKVATSMAGNTVSARFVQVDGADATNDADVNTLTVTRPLAAGTTLEVTYTDTDMTGNTYDKTVLDMELAVKF
ncbi:hypothetical protein N9351_04075, partial [Candidatus Thioglobus sp.]|nr:hypothetical protein [Candidatus Thioglobus sp.]